MNTHLTKTTIGLVLFSLISYLLAMHFSAPFPENVAIFLQQQWVYPFIPYLEFIFSVMLIISLTLVWRNANYVVYALAGTILFYWFLRWIPDLVAEYPLQSLAADLLSISLGILSGVLLTQIKKINLTDIQKLRLISLLFLIAYFITQIPFGEERLPRSFIEFIFTDLHLVWTSLLLPLIPLTAYTILIDPYTPKQKFLGYINHKTIFVVINLVLLFSPHRDALTGWNCLVCEVWSWLLGMMFALLWVTRGAERQVGNNMPIEQMI